MKQIDESKYFLPYQRAWLADESVVKLWEKSRRIGATYVQSYEDVRDCLMGRYPSVWFSSADESAAKEYIRYCVQWAELFDAVISEGVIKRRNGKNSYCINFINGSRITALSSNPKSFRSKGGKVCLDEFAHHQHQEELWKAARPVITWGFPVRILSTHNGKLNRFYGFIELIRSGELDWSLHRTDINDAVKEGLVDKISGRIVADEERENWISELRTGCADEYSWREEYLCEPVDESTSFLPYSLIEKCIYKEGAPEIKSGKSQFAALGIDVGRSRDLTVVWSLVKVDGIYHTSAVREFSNVSFAEQKDGITKIIKEQNAARVCIDSTGIGMQLGETLAAKFGQSVLERFVFNVKNKSKTAYYLKSLFEERKVMVPGDSGIISSLHSVSMKHTKSGKLTFDAPRGNAGHADHFWALALAVRAADELPGGTLPVAGKLRRKSRF